MQQNGWIPWETHLGLLGGAQGPQSLELAVPYHEALVRASGKDLAQGQVALIDPI